GIMPGLAGQSPNYRGMKIVTGGAGSKLDGGGRAKRRAGDDCFFRAIAAARRIEFGDALS
ncbi:hypothetical protein ACGYXG_32075, partial [Burkholderia pseudomallei]